MPDSSEYCNLLGEILDIFNKSNGKRPNQQRDTAHSFFHSLKVVMLFPNQLLHFSFLTAV